MGVDAKDLRTNETWLGMSDLVHRLRVVQRRDAALHVLDEHAASAETHQFSAAMRLWAADDAVGLARFPEAAKRYEALEREQGDEMLFGVPWAVPALASAANAWVNAFELGDATRCWERLLDTYASHRAPAVTLLEMGAAYEAQGRIADATAFYERAVDAGGETPDAEQVLVEARRALARARSDRKWFRLTISEIGRDLAQALRAGDHARLDGLLSMTHANVGILGGESVYAEREGLLKFLLSGLQGASIEVHPGALDGSGSRLMLRVFGWSDPALEGCELVIEHSVYGFEWVGLGIRMPDRRDADRIGRINSAAAAHRDGGRKLQVLNGEPQEPPTNPPVLRDRFYVSVEDLAMKCPYPAGMSFRAGSTSFTIETLITAASTFGLGPWAPIAVSVLNAGLNECGYGPGGLYYNSGFTHSADERFAIDFAHFSPWLPFVNATFGTPVLAVQDGVVRSGSRAFVSGVPDGRANALGEGNKVAIAHIPRGSTAFVMNRIATRFTDPDWRFTSFYLHLRGPAPLPVSPGMSVRRGAILGSMDSTGRSLGDHLHFSLHDSTVAYSGSDPARIFASFGDGVPPSPMDGTTLGVRDAGTCVASTNVPIA